MSLKIGDRYLPKENELTKKLKLSPHVSITTICYFDDSFVSVHIDKVPGFYTMEAKMTRATFGANFIENKGLINVEGSFKRSSHFTKIFPDYFLKLV